MKKAIPLCSPYSACWLYRAAGPLLSSMTPNPSSTSPEEETTVNVQLDYHGQLTTTYPAYGDGWTVTAPHPTAPSLTRHWTGLLLPLLGGHLPGGV